MLSLSRREVLKLLDVAGLGLAIGLPPSLRAPKWTSATPKWGAATAGNTLVALVVAKRPFTVTSPGWTRVTATHNGAVDVWIKENCAVGDRLRPQDVERPTSEGFALGLAEFTVQPNRPITLVQMVVLT